jgi:hypothetical protein
VVAGNSREKEETMILEEQETIILFDEADRTISLYTASRPVYERICKETKAIPDQVEYDKKKPISWTYKLPKTARGRKVILAAVDFD